MTGSGPDGDDPFVGQVRWLIGALGGKDKLVRASANRVSVRTLDNWMAGRYPRQSVTGAVRELDAWAHATVDGYPGAGLPPLVESCGASRPPVAVAVPDDEPADDETTPPDPQLPAGAPRRRWRRLVLLVGAGAAIAASSSGLTLAVMAEDEAPEQLGVLPSGGDGRLREELTGSLGANTFADPRALTDRALPIPPDTTVEVRCRYYAPSIPSVVPDGFWYLIESEEWAGRWAPANSFMNGDVPGGATLHNTDLDVPVCS